MKLVQYFLSIIALVSVVLDLSAMFLMDAMIEDGAARDLFNEYGFIAMGLFWVIYDIATIILNKDNNVFRGLAVVGLGALVLVLSFLMFVSAIGMGV